MRSMYPALGEAVLLGRGGARWAVLHSLEVAGKAIQERRQLPQQQRLKHVRAERYNA